MKSTSKEAKYPFGLAYAYLNQAGMALKTGDLKDVKGYLNKARKIAADNKFSQLTVDLNGLFFDYYKRKKDLKNMKTYATIFMNHPELIEIGSYVQRIVKYFEEAGDFRKAHEFNKKLMAIEKRKQEGQKKQDIQKMRV